MHEEIDKEKVRRLALEILEAIGGEDKKKREQTLREVAADDTPYTTVELARLLGVSQAWVTGHVSEFPGAFRLSTGQRANYRFPRQGVEEYIKNQAV